MILVWLILIPGIGGILAWASGRLHDRLPRWISVVVLGIDLLLTLFLWAEHSSQPGLAANRTWFAEVNQPWISGSGISFHVAIDGMSLILVMLSCFLGIMATIASWKEIDRRAGFFHFNLLWTLTGIIGVFLALDLFLFYFFWEVMLLPMYFLIALWGHENRVYASVKFFLFTQMGGLLMLAGILGLYFIHGRQTGTYTFDYAALMVTSMSPGAAMLLVCAFLAAFLVKLPAVPFHAWLPDAHTEAPTGGSVILAGLLLKTGAYGIVRFAIPLFPGALPHLSSWMMVLAVIGILYGGMLAFAQTDLKRLVAYTSVSHMGFVLLGIFAGNELALQGAIIQIVSHGIGTGALFMLIGFLQERIHTRDVRHMGGLWSTVPRMGGTALFFALASLGMPGMGSFVGEILVLVGTYKVSAPLAALGAVGFVVSTVYALWMIQRTFFGLPTEERKIADLTLREAGAMAAMMLALLWIGLYPGPVMRMAAPGLAKAQRVEGIGYADQSVSHSQVTKGGP